MTPEEFQRLKDAEKEHLRALKKLKQAVRRMERQKSLNTAITDLTTSTQNALDEHEQLVDNLALETARQEARLEIALSTAEAKAEVAEQMEQTPSEKVIDEAALDEEAAKLRARELVKNIKAQVEAATFPAVASSASATRRGKDAADEGNASGDADESSDTPRPEKTIGRMPTD